MGVTAQTHWGVGGGVFSHNGKKLTKYLLKEHLNE